MKTDPKSFNIEIKYDSQIKKIEILLKDQDVIEEGIGIKTIQDVLEEITRSIVENYCDISEDDFK